MANKDLDVANMAILQAGGETIDSFDDGTPLAEYAKANYPQARQWALGLHRWVFAMAIKPLDELANPPVQPRRHVFTLPNDLVGAVHAYRGSARIGGETLHDHVVFQGGVATDAPAVWAEYTREVPEHLWPSHFVEFMVKLFAAGVAQAKGDRSLAMDFYQKAVGAEFTSKSLPGGLLLLAQEADSRNAPERTLAGWDPGDLVAARFQPGASSLLIFTGPPQILTFANGDPTPTIGGV